MIHRSFGLCVAVLCAAWSVPVLSAAPPLVPSAAGPSVRILSPQPNARLSDPVVQVRFEAEGGPFADIVLYADSNLVDRLAPEASARTSGTLVWKGAPLGAHRLKVLAMDAEKNVAQAEVPVEVIAASAVRPPAGPAPQAGLRLRFLNAVNGGTLAVQAVGQGSPVASLRVEVDALPASATFPGYVYLDADGLDVGFAVNNNKDIPFRTEFKWPPLRGNGRYALVAKALSVDRGVVAEQRLTVEVTGFPASLPSPLERIIREYKQKFGLALSAPAVARFDCYTVPAESRYISIAYIGPTLYEVDLWDGGRLWSGTRPVNSLQTYPVCRPAGRLRLLVVFVDYGNTDLDQQTALAALKTAAGRINERHARYAQDRGWKAPILQLDVTGAYVSPPPAPGKLVTAGQAKSLTGFDPARYDMLLQVDLDSAHSYEQADPKRIAGGITFFKGCDGSGAREVNIWIEHKGGPQPDRVLSETLLSHELAHALGWQHTWPLGSGSGGATIDWNNDNPTWPAFLFGWTDSDGDGLPEILDPTPYGLKK